eukprot:Gb_04753 [translate_table: standard]
MEKQGESCGLAEELRENFKSGKTLSVEWRREQLDSILRLLRERRSEVSKALHMDLGKSSFQSFATEMIMVENSCKNAKKNLKKWMAPTKASTNVASFPSSACIVPEPFGVVLVIAPWNFPFLLSIDPMIGAISARNSVVLKPSEMAPATSATLAKLISLYLDSSAIRVMVGGPQVCAAVLQHRWDKIFFTGGPRVGRSVMSAAAKHITPVTLELGGKCPVLVDSTVNLEASGRQENSFWQMGLQQWPSVHRHRLCPRTGFSLAKSVGFPMEDGVVPDGGITNLEIDLLKTARLKFYGEDTRRSVDLSRMVNLNHMRRLRAMLDEPDVCNNIVHGGWHSEEDLYMEPTIVLDPPLDSTIMSEEIFGHILVVIRVKCMREAINLVNERPRPLAAYVFSNSKAVRKSVIKSVSVGAVVFNDTAMHFTVEELPIGEWGRAEWEVIMESSHSMHSAMGKR